MQMIGTSLMVLGTVMLLLTFFLAYRGNYFTAVKELSLIKKKGYVDEHEAPKTMESVYRKEAVRSIERPRSMDEESRKILDEVKRQKPKDGASFEKAFTEDTSEDEEKSVETENTPPVDDIVSTSSQEESTSVLQDESTSVLSEEGTAVLQDDNGTSVLTDDGTAVLSDEGTDILSEGTSVLPDEGTSVLEENIDS